MNFIMVKYARKVITVLKVPLQQSNAQLVHIIHIWEHLLLINVFFALRILSII